jgi:4-amino-4-deoxy-L-arabinose transferase-like glycosyltransferase
MTTEQQGPARLGRLVRSRRAGGPTLYDRLLDWLQRHAGSVWILIIVSGVVLRGLLVYFSPRPDGYVYDFYYEGVEHLDQTGRLPTAEDCWQCYHPPLFYAAGLVFYRAGWWLSQTREGALQGLTSLSLVSGCATALFSIGLLRLLRQRGAYLLLGGAVAIVFPCLFISSWSAEADSVQTALMSAFLYYLTKYDTGWAARSVLPAVTLGVLCGLAMATKHNGLIALASAGVLFSLRLLAGPRRLLTIRDGLIVLLIALSFGSWKYLDNMRRYGKPLYANLAPGEGSFGTLRHWDSYEYATLRLADAIRLYPPHAPEGRLTDQAVYYSVPTTLHAMAWTDMSFFSVPSRHGDPSRPYPSKAIPRWLIGGILLLALAPNLLALVGFVSTLERRALRACAIVTCLTAVIYTLWFAAQSVWALKTKYILYLLPAYVVYVVIGLRAVRTWRPAWLPSTLLAALLFLLGLSHLFLYAFATGALAFPPR